MMYKKIGFIELFQSLKKRLEEGTSYRMIDVIEQNEKTPFYFVEFVEKNQSNTKMMFCETVTLWIHAIAKAGRSKEEIYHMMQEVEEAMTQEIDLPSGYTILSQEVEGALSLNYDESGEWHAVIPVNVRVAYGLKTKN